jgi:serine/threonine protein kinase/Flp pilus assembly protein TadD
MKRCESCNIIVGDEHNFCPDDGRPLELDDTATRLQETLGAKYTLTKLIGKGAMGAVYRARHRDLDDVAIKVMIGPADNQQLSERFLREAKALRRLRHQHAVTIYDLDRSTPGLTYMVMEMIEGGSLREDLRERGRLNVDEVVEVAEAVCGALTAAHERGIIHRDLKPDNILVAEETTISGKTLRTIKIADFGIVKLRGNQREGEGDGMKLTQFGTPIGTPFYMSPEQWFGEGAGFLALDGRTDIYALGCTLYELLAGRTPFIGRTTSEVRRQHLEHEPVPLIEVATHVPLPVSRVIMRALAKDRDERQQSAAVFASELRRAYIESYGTTATTTHSQIFSPQLQEADTRDFEEKQLAPSLPHDTSEAGIAQDVQRVEAARQFGQELPREERQESSSVMQSADEPPVGVEVPEALGQPSGVSVGAYDSKIAVAPTEPDDVSFDPEATMVRNVADLIPPQQSPQPGDVVSLPQQPSPSSPAVHGKEALPLWVKLAFLALLIVVLCVAAVSGFYLYRYYASATPTKPTAPTENRTPDQSPPVLTVMPKGTLNISAPEGSEVFIDDEKAGTVGAGKELSLQATAGLRDVRVTASGFRPWTREARVRASQTTNLSARLQRPVEPKEATREKRLEEVDKLSRAGKHYEAEAEYRVLIKDNPNDAALRAKLAESLEYQKRYAEAITEYEGALNAQPNNVDTLLALGSLYEIKARDSEAEGVYRRALKIQPRNPGVRNLLAWVLHRHPDRLDEALSEVEQALAVRQESDFLDTKSFILLARNSLEEALQTQQSAIEKSRDPALKTGLAVILYRLGRTNEAITNYKQVRKADRSDEWGDIKRLQMLRGYNNQILETLAELIQKTNS